MAANCINKNTAILLIRFPSSSIVAVQRINELMDYLNEHCDNTVFPLVIQDNVNKVEIEFIGCKNIIVEEMEDLKKVIINLIKEHSKNK